MQEHNPTFFPPFSLSFPIPPLLRAVHLGVVFGAVRFHAVHFRAEKCLFELRASPGRPSVHSLGFRTSGVNECTLSFTDWAKTHKKSRFQRMYIELHRLGKNHQKSRSQRIYIELHRVGENPPEISRGRRVDEYTCEPHRVDSGYD